MDISVILWGAGKTAKRFIANHPQFIEDVNVIGVTDSDSNKWGSLLNQYEIEKPLVILQEKYDYIIILSIYFDEIQNSLSKTYSVPRNQILSIDEAYETYFYHKYGKIGGDGFQAPELIAGFSISESSYKRELREINELISYLYLKEKYLPYMQTIKERKKVVTPTRNIMKSDVPIWVCWLQGIENAPDIVRCCINSIKQNAEGTIHIITYKNFSDYVDLERCVIDKYKEGLISNTHFSDILRLALLYRYGGIWLDATILLMDSGLPDYVYELPLFMYKIRTTMDEGYHDPRKFSSWFISAHRENPLIGMTYRFLNYYWEKESKGPYYLMHYFIRLLWNQYEDDDKNKLILYNCNNRLLHQVLNKPYDILMWKMIKEEQPMQKLTYKQNFIAGDTFYQHMCDLYL